MNWTDKQYKAIYDRDKSILVAAAAGSGKTAVLVERIKQLILNDGCSIDRMLVVTFTDAAASEMKEKIEKAIRDEISSLSSDDSRESREKTDLLKRQLDLIPMAQISTFHSFAMEVVRRFFFTIGCEPNFKICDDANKAILQGNAMDRLFEERYASGDEAFTGFLRKFGSVKTDENVREMIDSLSYKLESMPEPMEWLDEKTEELRIGSEDMGDSSVIREIFREAGSVVRKSRKIFSENLALADRLGLEAGRSLPESDITSLDEIDAALKSGDYDRLKEAAWKFGIAKFNKKLFGADVNPGISAIELTDAMNDIKERRDYAKELIYDLRKDILTMSREQMARDISATYDDVLYLGGLVRE